MPNFIKNYGQHLRTVLSQVTKPCFSAVTVHIVNFESASNLLYLVYSLTIKMEATCSSKSLLTFNRHGITSHMIELLSLHLHKTGSL
jgi:hypothetical protein